jgi:hypothetical protein
VHLADVYVRTERRLVANLYQVGRMGMAIDATGMSAFAALLTSISMRMARPLREAEAMPSHTEDEDVDVLIFRMGWHRFRVLSTQTTSIEFKHLY